MVSKGSDTQLPSINTTTRSNWWVMLPSNVGRTRAVPLSDLQRVPHVRGRAPSGLLCRDTMTGGMATTTHVIQQPAQPHTRTTRCAGHAPSRQGDRYSYLESDSQIVPFSHLSRVSTRPTRQGHAAPSLRSQGGGGSRFLNALWLTIGFAPCPSPPSARCHQRDVRLSQHSPFYRRTPLRTRQHSPNYLED